MQDPENLTVWHEAVALAIDVHLLAPRLSPVRLPGLAAQICRASTSVASNIAEGAGRGSDAEMANSLSYAIGSCCEVTTQLRVAVGVVPTLAPLDDLFTRNRALRRSLAALRTHYLGKPKRPAAVPRPPHTVPRS